MLRAATWERGTVCVCDIIDWSSQCGEDRRTQKVQKKHLGENLHLINQTAFWSVCVCPPPQMMNDWSTSRVNSKSWKQRLRLRQKLHYSFKLGVHSKRSITVRLLAALFLSQRGLKALVKQMFKLAGEGIYNNFPPDKVCSLQKVLQSLCARMLVNKLRLFSEECF